jgi:PEP-CTERM motif-containing protein
MKASDRVSFQQAIGPSVLIDFEQFPPGPLCLPPNIPTTEPCTLSTAGVTFVSTQGGVTGQQRPQLSIDRGIGGHPGNALVENALPTTAGEFYLAFFGSWIAFDVVTASTFGSTVAAELLDVQGTTRRFAVEATIGSGSFFGLSGLVPSNYNMSLFAIPSGSATANFVIDNVVVAVPEPETYGLLLLGLGAIRIAGLRRRTKGG